MSCQMVVPQSVKPGVSEIKKHLQARNSLKSLLFMPYFSKAKKVDKVKIIYFYFYFLAVPRGLWDLSSLTRD